MVAPIPFLERLAPAVVQGAGLRPALPARFAPLQLNAPCAAVVNPDLSGDRAPALHDGPIAETNRHFEHPTPPAASQHGPLPQSPQSLHPVSILPTASSHTEALPATHPIPRASAALLPPVISTSVGRDQPPAVVGRTVAHPPATSGRPSAAAVLASPATRPPVYISPPLREPLVERHEPSSARFVPTEIHVSIDRIDVRAPASPSSGSPRPAAAKPRTASSLSLADYLRQPRPGGAR
jgi:hypothetical protein